MGMRMYWGVYRDSFEKLPYSSRRLLAHDRSEIVGHGRRRVLSRAGFGLSLLNFGLKEIRVRMGH